MAIKDHPDFETKLNQLKTLLELREEARTDIDQRYLTVESILDRIEALDVSNQLDGKRVLMIGDADLTGLAIAIFGNPQEVVVADIDDRLSEIYFEATVEFDLPVRFLYHDMRIKIIAILRKQYSLILMEPPRTIQAIEVYLSRAMEIIEPGDDNNVFISIPQGRLRDNMEQFIRQFDIEIKSEYAGINEYLDGSSPSDFIELTLPNDVEPKHKSHHVRPFYEHEVDLDIKEYRCVCRKTYEVGDTAVFVSIEELEDTGCKACGYDGVFAFKSDIQLK